ncbi:MAG TPA: zf-HC2 domain-containing protein [bacterium]
MKCDEARELITSRIDGEIRKEEDAPLSLHLKECRRCSQELQEEKELQRRLNSLYKDKKAWVELKEEIIRMINERTTSFPAVVAKRFPFLLFAGLGLAAVAVVIFYLFFVYYQ